MASFGDLAPSLGAAFGGAVPSEEGTGSAQALQAKVTELEAEKNALLQSLENMVALYGVAKETMEARARVRPGAVARTGSGVRLVDCDKDELISMVLQLREEVKIGKEQIRVAVGDKMGSAKIAAREIASLKAELSSVQEHLAASATSAGVAGQDADATIMELTNEKEMLLHYSQKLERQNESLSDQIAVLRDDASRNEEVEKLNAQLASATSHSNVSTATRDVFEHELSLIKDELGFEEAAVAADIVEEIRQRLAQSAQFGSEMFTVRERVEAEAKLAAVEHERTVVQVGELKSASAAHEADLSSLEHVMAVSTGALSALAEADRSVQRQRAHQVAELVKPLAAELSAVKRDVQKLKDSFKDLSREAAASIVLELQKRAATVDAAAVRPASAHGSISSLGPSSPKAIVTGRDTQGVAGATQDTTALRARSAEGEPTKASESDSDSASATKKKIKKAGSRGSLLRRLSMRG